MSIPHSAHRRSTPHTIFSRAKKSAVPADFLYTDEKDSVGYRAASHHAPPRSPSSVCFHESKYSTLPLTKKESMWKTHATDTSRATTPNQFPARASPRSHERRALRAASPARRPPPLFRRDLRWRRIAFLSGVLPPTRHQPPTIFFRA